MIKNRTNTNDKDVTLYLIIIGLMVILFVIYINSFNYFFGNDFFNGRLSTIDTENTNTDNQQEAQTIMCREFFRQPVIDFCTNHSRSVVCRSEKVNRLLKSKQCPDVYHIVFYHMHMIFARFSDDLIRFLTEPIVLSCWQYIVYTSAIVFVSFFCYHATIRTYYINIIKRMYDLEEKLSKKKTSLKKQTTISNNSELVIDDSKEKSQ